MRKILKYSGYTLLTFVLLILLYLGCAWVLSRVSVAAEPDADPEVVVFLKSNGVHADIVVPLQTADIDWSRQILYKNTRSGDSSFRYVAIGWGDKDFYLHTQHLSDLNLSTGLKAVFGLSPPAVHATFCDSPAVDDRCVRLVINRDQYRRLAGFIAKSLQYDNAGIAIPVATSVRYDDHDAFYESKGSYNLFHTCNTWANDALKASGQKACWWTPFVGGIFYHYR